MWQLFFCSSKGNHRAYPCPRLMGLLEKLYFQSDCYTNVVVDFTFCSISNVIFLTGVICSLQGPPGSQGPPGAQGDVGPKVGQ